MAKIKHNNQLFTIDDGWEVGDKVKCLEDHTVNELYVPGYVYTLEPDEDSNTELKLSGTNLNGLNGTFELVEEVVEYENKWHLNDGKPIPDNAQTLEHEGRVVAYRLPVERAEVGDFVMTPAGKEVRVLSTFLHNGLDYYVLDGFLYPYTIRSCECKKVT
jgi:hypothetical protein